MEVRFVTDRSVSPKAAEYIRETMKALGAEGPMAETGQFDEVVFLQTDENGDWSRWLVLPDGRMLLFDFQGDAALNWKVGDLSTKVRYEVKYWHMSKALISPSGEILSK